MVIDATVMAIAERLNIVTVLTLDRRDFIVKQDKNGTLIRAVSTDNLINSSSRKSIAAPLLQSIKIMLNIIEIQGVCR